jgi:hypothetical protein
VGWGVGQKHCLFGAWDAFSPKNRDSSELRGFLPFVARKFEYLNIQIQILRAHFRPDFTRRLAVGRIAHKAPAGLRATYFCARVFFGHPANEKTETPASLAPD